MAWIANAVIGKKNKTWCDNFILEAMPTPHNRSHPWRGWRATNRTATMLYVVSLDATGFSIYPLLKKL